MRSAARRSTGQLAGLPHELLTRSMEVLNMVDLGQVCNHNISIFETRWTLLLHELQKKTSGMWCWLSSPFPALVESRGGTKPCSLVALIFHPRSALVDPIEVSASDKTRALGKSSRCTYLAFIDQRNLPSFFVLHCCCCCSRLHTLRRRHALPARALDRARQGGGKVGDRTKGDGASCRCASPSTTVHPLAPATPAHVMWPRFVPTLKQRQSDHLITVVTCAPTLLAIHVRINRCVA